MQVKIHQSTVYKKIIRFMYQIIRTFLPNLGFNLHTRFGWFKKIRIIKLSYYMQILGKD